MASSDGIKISCDITDKAERERILGADIFDFDGKWQRKSGEIKETYFRAYHRGLVLIIKKAKEPPKDRQGQHKWQPSDKWRLTVEGSIHNYFHGSNHTNFTFKNCCDAFDQLADSLGIALERFKIHYLEFGVNVRVELPPSKYYDDFILYQSQPFEGINYAPLSEKTLRGRQCQNSNIIIKVYDKGHQKGLDYHLLRFEIKALRMRYVQRKTGINRPFILTDLKDKEVYLKLGKALVKVHNEILKVKEVDTNGLNESSTRLIEMGRHPTYWLDLKKNEGRNRYKVRLRNFKAIQREFVLKPCRQEQLVEGIWTTVLKLSESENIGSKVPMSTPSKEDFNNENGKQKVPMSTPSKEDSENGQKGAKVPLGRLGYTWPLELILLPHEKERHEKGLCIICGTDISHKRAGTKYCSVRCKNKKTNSYHNCQRKLKKLIKEIEQGNTIITMEYLAKHEDYIMDQIMQSIKSYRDKKDLTKDVTQYDLFNQPPLTKE
ncbi:MAG: hypothetical protein AAF960_23425 [Bacteroidota bacterium]